MIVWGGQNDNTGSLNTGGRYDPSTDSWTPTSTTNAPEARELHSAVWTGGEMIVWGGINDFVGGILDTGGRYNPTTDTWTATSTTNVPDSRYAHTAVWTQSEMIVWGGVGNLNPFVYLNTGGRYDPSTDSWTATSTTNAPAARRDHTAVSTESEMIVWGGDDDSSDFNTGGRYNPVTDSWTATTTTNAPDARDLHTAVWTDSEMIVWGGGNDVTFFNSGGRYDPATDSWTVTSTINAPEARIFHTAIWTDSEMIVWGGRDENFVRFNTGGKYCVGAPTPTPTPTVSPTPTPTATPCAGRCSPTPRPRPSPAPRPTPR
jgi:N-acetylneuraminic acid mutarotase